MGTDIFGSSALVVGFVDTETDTFGTGTFVSCTLDTDTSEAAQWAQTFVAQALLWLALWRLRQLSQSCLCPLCRFAGVCIKCASAKCAHCAVSVAPQAIEPIMSVSVSAKPTTRALEPKMSVPSVPLRWCLYQVCQRQVCPLCRFSGVVCSGSRRSTVVTTILLLYHYNDHYNFFFYTIA